MAENEFTKANRGKGLPSQEILDAGLNVFALQLLLESFTEMAGDYTKPIEFPYRGVDVRLRINSDGRSLVCDWTYDDYYDNWEASCGLSWQLVEGKPSDHEMAYCPKCGRPLAEIAKEEEE